jgi:hypothetical protein
LAAGGTIMGGQGSSCRLGNRQKDASYFKAAQEDQAAQESRAASQRSALEKDRQTGLLQSTLAGAMQRLQVVAHPILTIIGLSRGHCWAAVNISRSWTCTRARTGRRGLEDQADGLANDG